MKPSTHRSQPAATESGPRAVPPPIPAFSWGGSLSPLLLVPMAIPVLAALFAPTDVLDLWPWARRFTDWMQRLLAFIPLRGHADSTTYAQAALLTHCLTLAVLPITSLVWLWQSIVNYPYLLLRRRAIGPLEVRLHLAMLLGGPPLFLAATYFFVALAGDPSFARGMTTNNRAGFAFLTFAANYCTSLALGGQLANLRLLIDTHIRRGD